MQHLGIPLTRSVYCNNRQEAAGWWQVDCFLSEFTRWSVPGFGITRGVLYGLHQHPSLQLGMAARMQRAVAQHPDPSTSRSALLVPHGIIALQFLA